MPISKPISHHNSSYIFIVFQRARSVLGLGSSATQTAAMPVVYDGVNGNGDGQGDLFQGLKLWIAHRVPLRSKYVDLVKGNGGQVVQLEKNADMLIADHIKKGGISAPDGSYSWQWIDFSVKNGHLQDKEDYLIRAEARTVGSSQPVKGRRTAFNANDDFILTRWVMANERNGSIASSGNEIYKEFEKKASGSTGPSSVYCFLSRP